MVGLGLLVVVGILITTVASCPGSVVGVEVTGVLSDVAGRITPAIQQIRMTKNIPTKTRGCFFAGGFAICWAGLLGAGTCWDAMGFVNSRPQ